MRCLMIVPGSEIIGAFLNDAPFPLSSSLDSHPTVESYLVGVSLISIAHAPFPIFLANGKRESLWDLIFAIFAIKDA